MHWLLFAPQFQRFIATRYLFPTSLFRVHPVIKAGGNMEYPLFFLALLSAFAVQAGELKLELEGKGMAGNQVRVAVYSANAPEQFPSEEKYYRGVVYEATSDRLTVRIPDLPPGKYAVGAFVDNNRNGKQDKNFVGVPKEIYGFSNNARGTFGSPDFAEAAFDIGENDAIKSIHLH
jgi:uncharacterized protein (DUF2141 family)